MSSISRYAPRLMLFNMSCLLVVVAILAPGIAPVQAASGMPDSAEFGYGVHIDVWGQNIDFALQTIDESGIDWIAIDFDWERHWPQRSATLDLASFDSIMTFARTNDKYVLLSITNAPEWAITPSGPDPELTAGLVAQLIRLYPEILLAVELFPAANTIAGWGAVPNPAAYASLIKTTAVSLQAANRSTVLVAAGLEPIDPAHAGSDLNDLVFLRGLYQAGVAAYLPIIGVRLPDTAIDPLATPGSKNPYVLRHYEAVRQVMLENEHTTGLIWITAFTWPEKLGVAATHTAKSTLGEQDFLQTSQTQWFTQAFQMMKSQLYIGAAFYSCLNPPAQDSSVIGSNNCLIQGEIDQNGLHPAYSSLVEMIALGNPDAVGHQRLVKIITSQKPKSLLKTGAP